jgi:hypothetical protein
MVLNELTERQARAELRSRDVAVESRCEPNGWVVIAMRDGRLVEYAGGLHLLTALRRLIERVDEHDARVPRAPGVPAEARALATTAAPVRGEETDS